MDDKNNFLKFFLLGFNLFDQWESNEKNKKSFMKFHK